MNLMFWEIKKTFENWAKAIEKNCKWKASRCIDTIVWTTH